MQASRLGRVSLVTLILLFGLHFFRVLLPTVIAYLGQFVGPFQQALFALGIFVLPFLAAFLRRYLRERAALAVVMGSIALVRLALQFAGTPLAQLALAALGMVLFGCFLPLWHQSPRNRPSADALPVLVLAFPLAFIFDTASRTILLTYDWVWRRDPLSAAIAIALVVLAVVLLWRELRRPEEQATHEPSLACALPFIGVGAFLYLALVITQNPAALAATGMDDNVAMFAVNLLNAAGVFSCIAAARLASARWALGVGSALVAALALLLTPVPLGALWFALASVALWALLGWVLTGTARVPRLASGLWRTSLATVLALIFMLVAVFVVGQYDFRAINLLAGIILLAAAFSVTRSGYVPARKPAGAPVMAIADIAVVVVAAWLLLRPSPALAPGMTLLRVMTYNIHQGISADMQVSLDQIADAIAAQNPDVVALNEVNRARPNYGLIDTLPYLADRLGMRYVFGANYPDGQYGNAILTRDPIVEWNNTHYRDKTTEVRGLLRVTLQMSNGNTLTLYSTHLDHIGGPKNVRAPQVAELLSLWNKTPRSIIMGDLNAKPSEPELQALYQAGLTDALAATGNDAVYTFWDPVPTPGRRIDFIFATPDVSVLKTWTVPTRASDHLPVVAEIGIGK